MKILILGGGVAGLSLCKRLLDCGFDVKVVEKSTHHGNSGHGFALLPNGINALKQLGILDEVIANGQLTKEFILRNERNELVLRQELESHLTILRAEVIKVLLNYTREHIIYGTKMESFTYGANDMVQRVNFDNGESLDVDLVVAADGVNSAVRELLFSEVRVRNSKVKELVTSLKSRTIASKIGDRFIKTKSDKGGLSCGVLGAGKNNVILFCQYDRDKYKLNVSEKNAVYKFMLDHLGNWPEPIPQLLSHIDYQKIHRWDIYERKLTSDVYRKNVVLIGDAAHTFIPLTSQGANSALVDAVTLSNHIMRYGQSYDIMLSRYQAERKWMYERYFEEGMMLEENFLKPRTSRKNKIPLVS